MNTFGEINILATRGLQSQNFKKKTNFDLKANNFVKNGFKIIFKKCFRIGRLKASILVRAKFFPKFGHLLRYRTKRKKVGFFQKTFFADSESTQKLGRQFSKPMIQKIPPPPPLPRAPINPIHEWIELRQSPPPKKKAYP